MSKLPQIKSISQVHNFLAIESPRHPLVSVIQAKDIESSAEMIQSACIVDLYSISLKDGISGSFGYGRNHYDFDNGTMVFTSPGQIITMSDQQHGCDNSGWSLLFHPDLIRKSDLGQTIDAYNFFSYDTHEALHISDNEKRSLSEIVQKIEDEYRTNIDRHSQKLIIANIELLLDYCTRFYDRQFYTRSNLNRDILTKFELLIKGYFQDKAHLTMGIPTVAYCGKALNISPKYLSDLLKRETGKNAKYHIDEFLINRAKNLLLSSTGSVREIAFGLGFEYSQHFSRMFKAKTGMTPLQYRTQN